MKSRCDLELDRTMPNVEVTRAISIYYSMFNFSSELNHYFFELSCTDTHTHTHTEGQEYSIVAVDTPQL